MPSIGEVLPWNTAYRVAAIIAPLRLDSNAGMAPLAVA